MRVLSWLAVAVAALSCGSAGAQMVDSMINGNPRERADPVQSTRPAPMDPEGLAWAAREVVPGADWRAVYSDHRGVVLAKPAGAMSASSEVPVKLRLEYRRAIDLNGRHLRSVAADIRINCTAYLITGRFTAYAGQNLTGDTFDVSSDTIRPGSPSGERSYRSRAIPLMTSTVLRSMCDEGLQHGPNRYGPDWRIIGQEIGGTTLVRGRPSMGLDRHVAATFRLEGKETQPDLPKNWRSALVKVDIDCLAREFTAQAALYDGPNQTGKAIDVVVLGAAVSTSVHTWFPGSPKPDMSPRPINRDTGSEQSTSEPLWSAMRVMGKGRAILESCEAAEYDLANALAGGEGPLRAAAQAWLSNSLNTKGWRSPVFIPEGVLLLSDDVENEAALRRAVVRAEYSRPLNVRGQIAASRLTLVEFDCAKTRLRGLREDLFAKNGAKEPLSSAKAPNAGWSDIDDAPLFSPYFSVICAGTPAG